MRKIKILKMTILSIAVFGLGFFSSMENVHAKRFFTENSVWYQKIPTGQPTLTNSSNYIDHMVADSNNKFNIGLGETPVVRATSETPIHEMTILTGMNPLIAPTQRGFGWEYVPMPTDALPGKMAQCCADGVYRDRLLTVISHDEKYAWDIMNGNKCRDGAVSSLMSDWTVKSIRRWDLTGDPDPVQAGDGDGVPLIYNNEGGSRACGSPLLHGMIFPDELKVDKVIDHAIAISVNSGCLYYDDLDPCHTNAPGSYDTHPYCLKTGMRLQLRSDYDLDGYCTTEVCKIYGQAMKDYGLIIVDWNSYKHNMMYGATLTSAAPFPEWAGISGSPWGMGSKGYGILLNSENFRIIEPLTADPNLPIILADINSDGKVNIKDIQACIKVITRSNLTYENQCSVLATPNATTNIKDIQVIIRKIINP